MKKKITMREKRRRLMQTAQGQFDPASQGERTAILSQFVERHAPSNPGVVEGIQRLYDDVRAEHPNADEDQIDMIVIARHIALRRAEKGRP